MIVASLSVGTEDYVNTWGGSHVIHAVHTVVTAASWRYYMLQQCNVVNVRMLATVLISGRFVKQEQ